MGRISLKFTELARSGEKALVTFITAGDPDLAVTESLVPEIARAGADIIELGIPFSDPMADGPVIQRASERALAAGTTLPGILAMVQSVRQATDVPLVLMGYCNPILAYGSEQFVVDAVKAGVDGVLVVDLPPEEAADFRKHADREGLDVISLLTPTSDDARIASVLKGLRGFIYYVSVTGVTGVRRDVDSSLVANVSRIKAQTTLPVAVGFGVSTPEQAAEIALCADGVVVGSAIVKLFEQFQGEELVRHVRAFVSSLKNGLKDGA